MTNQNTHEWVTAKAREMYERETAGMRAVAGVATGPVPFHAAFAYRLKDARERQRLTQQDLADLMAEAGTPINRATIAKIESGTTRSENVSLGEVMAFAAVLGVAPTYLITPRGFEPSIRVNQDVVLDPVRARQWFIGNAALDERTARTYFSDVADHAYASRQRIDVQVLVQVVQALLDAQQAGEEDEELADRIREVNGHLDLMGAELSRWNNEIERRIQR